MQRHEILPMMVKLGHDREALQRMPEDKLRELFSKSRHRDGDVRNELHLNWDGGNPSVPVIGGPCNGQAWHQPPEVIEVECKGAVYHQVLDEVTRVRRFVCQE